MKTLFIVAIAPAITSTGGVVNFGDCICSFDSDLSDAQIKAVDEAISCANISLVDSITFNQEYTQPK